jgi:hypothetical protein
VAAHSRDDDAAVGLEELLDAALDAMAALIPVGPPAPEPAPAEEPGPAEEPAAEVPAAEVPVLPEPRVAAVHVAARSGRDRGARLWRRVVGARALPPRPAAGALVEPAGV